VVDAGVEARGVAVVGVTVGSLLQPTTSAATTTADKTPA
jgi:hypothetical protein